MKKVVFLLMMLFCFTSLMQAKEHPRKKVAVVLSGGSAKGFVHVGVLKVLERAGIPIDYIAGTSMGAVVGGLYAVGYDAEMIDSLIQQQDWNYLMSDNIYRVTLPATQRDRGDEFIVSLPYSLNIRERSGNVSLPRGVFSGQNLYSLFLNLTIGFQHEMDFDDLPTPFGCVAADVRTGKEVEFRKGILPEAIRASMALPGVFTPVEKDSMLLIDGGVINNYPVDLARRMGADIVIGVIIPPDEKAKEQNRGNITEIAEQLTNFVGKEKKLQNIDDTDLLITPNVHPFRSMDFHKPAIDSLIVRGERAAMNKWEALMTLKASLGITGDDSTVRKRQNPYINLDTLLVDHVSVEGVSARDEQRILQLLPEQIKKVTRKELNAMTARIFGAGLFSRVTYRLDGDLPFNLVFLVEPKEYNTLNLGIHFDTSDMAAILANTTVRLSESYNSMIDITTRLSRDPYLQIDYSVNNNLFYRGGISYRISNNDLSIYNRGKLSYQFEIIRNALDLNFSEFYFGNVQLHLGAGFEYFDFSNLLGRNEIPNPQGIEDQLYINYMINGVFDNLNSTYFPSSGQYFSFRYTLHTDNFLQLEDGLPLSVLKMNFFKPLQLGSKTYLTPRITARYVMNDSVPYIYRNFVGGRNDGHYIAQEIAVQGSAGMEVLDNMVASVDAMLHHEMSPQNYLYFHLNYTLHHNHLYNLFQGDGYWGGNIGYSFLSIAGPMRIELGYSGLSRKIHPYACFGYYF